MLRKRLL
jgi:MATE family multidrug resistance protein